MLRPLVFTDAELQEFEKMSAVKENLPGKTYRIDFDRQMIFAEYVDQADALRQAIIKIIKTPRDRHLIYTSDYGCEIYNILGQGYSIEYLNLEVPRMIDEALSIDDRIVGTDNYTIEKQGDNLYVTFNVNTTLNENFTVGVTI
jgi:hypothetical protein